MRVIVFGATGTVGTHVIQQSLDKGYTTTAFCRHPDKLLVAHAKLHTVSGDVTRYEDVQRSIKNQEAVIIVLGSGKNRKGTVRSRGTQNVIQAMREHSVKRLVCQTTLGCGDSRSNLNFFWKHIMFGWFLKQVFLDHELQEEYVRNSGLDWTIIRPGAFTNGPNTGNYQHGFDAHETSLKLKIARADVADFALRQLATDRYLHQTPGLSY